MPMPFEKFYPKEWEGDAQLMACSLAARGLWRHMLNTMREAEPFGFFVGRDGEPVDLVAFAKRINARPAEVRKLIDELIQNNVPSIDRQGRLFSRRQVRELAKSQAASEFGKMGGNPILKPDGITDEDIHPGLSPKDKPSDIPRARTLDTRCEILDISDSLRSSALKIVAWPKDVEALRRLAMIFVAEFANCRDAKKAERHVGPYTGVLAAIRGRGLTIEQAWQACVDARDACGGRPLFGAGVKSAISFLPGREAQKSPRPSEYMAGLQKAGKA